MARLLLLRRVAQPRLRALALFLLFELRRERVAEICGFEDLTDLDFAFAEWRAFEPFDRLGLRLHLPEPETGDQLLRLGEGAVDDGLLVALESDACAFG